MTQYYKKTGAIGLTFKKTKTRCVRCDLPLSISFWKGRIIVYSINSRPRPDQICIKCMTRNSNVDRNFYHSPEQLNKFIEDSIV